MLDLDRASIEGHAQRDRFIIGNSIGIYRAGDSDPTLEENTITRGQAGAGGQAGYPAGHAGENGIAQEVW